MDYTPSQKKFYIGNETLGKTFEFDSNLAKLPVPDLKQTLDKYLRSIQPFVSLKDYKEAEKECLDFLNSGEGEILQNLLLKKAKVCENCSNYLFNFKFLNLMKSFGYIALIFLHKY